ncbi:hypothetical protein TraAM80_02367 [Trypanosoma rangeli]|uniref:Uncharacterized protein n=1 Tax=Trypanosoma rangeli TaxID=5698 RepID=A0A3R7KSS1_TRYRA|nr:uncharacterized protein TraAM80_02367 [Trypanosoma rangeli]RNF08960.1 hypothetical protein TraAM80_02367 [Trypanosoma rangeli]|eukprot:RNF08960.1 hypothetical protein TraAM80_02367 [Trypanosoma rangeli]
MASRYAHGSWRCISMRELEEHMEYFSEPPFLSWQVFTVRCPAQVKQMQLVLEHYLLRAIVSLMIILSIMVMDIVSILMVMTSLFGLVLPSETYVILLLFCYLAIAAGIVLEFVAALDNRLQQPFFMFYVGTGVPAFVAHLAQCCINSLLVLSVSMFRLNSVQR